MKIKNLFPCLGVSWCKAWACLGVVPLRAGRNRARPGVASCEAWVLPALIAVLNLIPAGRVTAQIFTTLHSFTATVNSGPPTYSDTNSDGGSPFAGLIANSSGNTLYGTTYGGGSSGNGTIFAVNADGTGFTNLHSFSANSGPGYTDYTNSDGAYPYGGLVLLSNTLYGTAAGGGTRKDGTVFAIKTDGTGFTNLHTFMGSDGADPNAGLTLGGSTLYGTASYGGSPGSGTLFALNTDGTGFTILHSFTATSHAGYSDGTNSDGANPYAGLILSGNTLYGTALNGGGGNGTVFALNTNGTGFTNLHSFTPSPRPGTNSDGRGLFAGLVLSGNKLYGTASFGGSSDNGTVFAVNTDGTGFTNLHNFTALDQTDYTNSDGVEPFGGLVLSGNTLYGTATSGGSSGLGAMFAIQTDGTGFTTLHNFTLSSDGADPEAGLLLSGNTLYGTTHSGGSDGNGTVFSLSFRPQLTITPSGTNIILSWPTGVAGFSYAGYILQETANPGSPLAWVPSSFFPPVISNGQIRLTGPMLGPQRFYRLVQ